MPATFDEWVRFLDAFLWGAPMLLLLLGTHIFLTIRTGLIQRKTFLGIRLSFAKEPESSGDISQFGALTTSLASTLGTGNIIGLGTAVALGGPGAVFWCWVTGVLGIATKYAEALLAVKYRVQTADGRTLGGAMYVLERALGMKHLARLFALFTALATLGIGCGVQVNAISTVMEESFHIAPLSVGVLVCALAGLVIFGGVKSISTVCERLVPFMGLLFLAGNFYLLWMNRAYLWDALCCIVALAFQPGAAAGGLVGSGFLAAARAGTARGLFSNESGMGSAPIVAAAAQTRNPVRQALVSATGTFWDTVVLCLITGLVIVSSLMRIPSLNTSQLADGGLLTTLAFAQIPIFGPIILSASMVLFAFSTILGWSYYGERGAEYLLGKRALIPYRILFCAVLLIAPTIALDTVWAMADILNALMAIPNLIAVLLLSGVVAADTRYYLRHLDESAPAPSHTTRIFP